MTVREEIVLQLKRVLKEMTGVEIEPQLSFPSEAKFGDYSTNVAMVSFAKATATKKAFREKIFNNPMELAEGIVENFKFQISNFKLPIARVEVVRPGFINFWVSEEYLFDSLKSRLNTKDAFSERGIHSAIPSTMNSDRIDSGQVRKGKKVMIEFTDPNPFKEMHIGHLYSNIVGESLARLLEEMGSEVWRVTYQGDVGLHVAKSLWGILRKFSIFNFQFSKKSQDSDLQSKLNDELEKLEKESLQAKAKFLGEAYALGATAYEGDSVAKGEIIEINKKVYSKEDQALNNLYAVGKQWSLAYFESIYELLGSTFMKNYFESDAAPVGLACVKEYMEKGVFRESEGAIVFPEEISGLHTRVFINSLGLPTYEAKELGLAPTKYKDFPYDESIILTGNEIDEYFKVLLKALSFIHPELAKKTKHLSHGMVRLPEGKMSSRTGKVITAEWLLTEAVTRAGRKVAEIMQNGKEGSNDSNAVVGIGAVKYALLKHSIGKDVEFTFDDSISFEGNSGPYLQYTYVRTKGILLKAGISDFNSLLARLSSFEMSRLQLEELSLLRALSRFEEIIEETTTHFAPHLLASYLFELAQLFNIFYQKMPILKDEKVIRDFRLVLVASTGEVMKKGLYLLGIEVPEKM